MYGCKAIIPDLISYKLLLVELLLVIVMRRCHALFLPHLVTILVQSLGLAKYRVIQPLLSGEPATASAGGDATVWHNTNYATTQSGL